MGIYPKLNKRFIDLIALCLLLTCFLACGKWNLRIYDFRLSTGEVIQATITSATVSGNVDILPEDEVILDYGHCWATNSQSPTLENAEAKTGFGAATAALGFVSNLNQLSYNTVYFVRAYAITNFKTYYGEVKSFLTTPIGITTGTTYNVIGDSIEVFGSIIGLNGEQLSNHGHYWKTGEFTATDELYTNSLNLRIENGIFSSMIPKDSLTNGLTITLQAFAQLDELLVTGQTVVLDLSDIWLEKAPFPGKRIRNGVAFSIGSKAYLGTGSVSGIYPNDFWEYDKENNRWRPIADFPGVGRKDAVAFSVGNKGYVATGFDKNDQRLDDLWEYNPETNSWVQKTSFKGGGRVDAIALSIDNRAYVGFGSANNPDGNQGFWEYDPQTDNWTEKQLPEIGIRTEAVSFSIAGKGYVGLGDYGTTRYQDFWEYDPALDQWSPKANFAGEIIYDAVGFSINGKGYLGTGGKQIDLSFFEYDEFWEYDPLTNSWKRLPDYPGIPRASAVGFSIGNQGYIVTGASENDFWEYTPAKD